MSLPWSILHSDLATDHGYVHCWSHIFFYKYYRFYSLFTWWCLTSLKNNVVSFSHLQATTSIKTRETLKVKKKLGLYWHILCRRTKRLNILSLFCKPLNLFQAFNWKFIQKTHRLWDEGTASAEMFFSRDARYRIFADIWNAGISNLT